MSGSMWQGMKTRQGDGTEALSEEMESNGSATPKSRRHPLTLPADGGYAPRFMGIFLALDFSRFGGESTLPPTAANANRWCAKRSLAFLAG